MNKNKKNPLLFLRDKRFKYGGYAVLMTIVVILLIAVFNIGVTALQHRFGLKWDLTANRTFEISEDTKTLLSELDRDITVYVLSAPGQEDAYLMQYLNRYHALSDGRVKIQAIDPVSNPSFAAKFQDKYATIQRGSIIVAGPEDQKYKLLNQYEIYTTALNENNEPYITGLQVEQKLTSAIIYIAQQDTPMVYFLTGHLERSLTESAHLAMLLRGENYEVSELSLASADASLKKGDAIVINSPKTDLTADEREKLRAFLADGGKAMFLIEPYADPLPNFESLIELFGIGMNRDYVLEQSVSHYYPQPMYLLPVLQSSDILTPMRLKQQRIWLVESQSLAIKEILPDTRLQVTPLLLTSDQAYTKPFAAFQEFDSIEQLNYNPETDPLGEFVLAACAELRVGDVANDNARIVVVGSGSFAYTESQTNSQGNSDFLLNSLSWLYPNKDTFSVRSISLQGEGLKLKSLSHFNTYVVLAFIAPVLILVAGIAVWLRRRHL